MLSFFDWSPSVESSSARHQIASSLWLCYQLRTAGAIVTEVIVKSPGLSMVSWGLGVQLRVVIEEARQVVVEGTSCSPINPDRSAVVMLFKIIDFEVIFSFLYTIRGQKQAILPSAAPLWWCYTWTHRLLLVLPALRLGLKLISKSLAWACSLSVVVSRTVNTARMDLTSSLSLCTASEISLTKGAIIYRKSGSNINVSKRIK